MVGPHAGSSCTKTSLRATSHLFIPRPILLNTWHVHLDLERTGTRTEMNCATIVSEHGDRENLSRQKSSHLFFVRHSLCQETPNKEGATVITPFLPPGFSRTSARKTRQSEPSRLDLTKAHHIRMTSRWGLGRISRSLTKFDQSWPRLTKFDLSQPSLTRVWPIRSDPTRVHYTQKPSKRGPGYISQNLERFDQFWPGLTKVWPNHWPDRKLDQADHPLTNT